MEGDIPWHYVALVVIAFISWLFNRIQEATAERRRLHELKRRREEQKHAPQPTRPEPSSSSSPPPIPQGRRPATRHEPEEKAEEILRDLFEALGGPPQEAPEPVRPRHEPPPERPKPPPITRKPAGESSPQRPAEPLLSEAEKAALERVKTGRSGIPGSRRRTADSQANFRRLLRSSGGLRQAVIVKEILDAPLALRDDPASGRETT